MRLLRMPYTAPTLEVIQLEDADVMTASGGVLSNDGLPTYDDGGWT